MAKFNVSYDIIYAGLVEIEADDEDAAVQELLSWPYSKLLKHAGEGDLVPGSVNVSPGAPEDDDGALASS